MGCVGTQLPPSLADCPEPLMLKLCQPPKSHLVFLVFGCFLFFFALHVYSSCLFSCQLFFHFLVHIMLQGHAHHLVNGPTDGGIEQKFP